MTAPSSVSVLHCLDAVRFEEGGVVRCVVDLCKVLAEHKTQVTLATWDPQDIPADWGQVPGMPSVLNVAEAPEQFKAAMETHDVFHLHVPWSVRNLSIARSLRKRKLPYLISIHGMLDDWSMAQRGLKKRCFLKLGARRMLENAYRVHCTAQGEARQASRWFPRGKSAVLPLIVDLPAAGDLPGPELAQQAYPALQQAEPKVLFLSRLHPKKAPDVLLNAANLARQAGTKLQLLFAGVGEPGYEQSLKQLAERLGLASVCHFLGMVQGDLKWSLYQAADLMALPTFQENFGLVFPEALACATPVMTTKGVDIWPELEAAGGVIVENSPEVVSQQLVRLLADLPALAQRGREGQVYVNEWLDRGRVVQRYQQLYCQAVGSR